MGSPGPIPKRSEERRRRNKENPVETVPATGNVKPATCPASLHAEARGWYQSLADSGQSQFYEPSDWRQARVLAIILDNMLEAPRVSAQLFAAWCSAASELGTTEGARRRVHIEIDRKPQKPALAAVTVMDEYRDALGG